MTIKSRPAKTIDDYLKLPDDVRAELIHGELLVSPSPTLRHQAVVKALFRVLDDHLRSQNLGELHLAPLDVHLPSGDIVQPDLIFVSCHNRGILQDWIRGVPDLLIEVVSHQGAERDRIIKRELYARNGVPEYWIVEDAPGSVEVLILAGGSYEPHGYFETGDLLTSPILPLLTFDVGQLFAPA